MVAGPFVLFACCLRNVVGYQVSLYIIQDRAVVDAQRGDKGKLGGGGALILMHGRSGMTIGPRIPTMPGRRTSGVHRSSRHYLRQVRSAVTRWVSVMKVELHPTMSPF